MENSYLTGYSFCMNPYLGHDTWGGAVGLGALGGAFFAGFAIFIIIAVIWELAWKGLALWHAAKNGQVWWFVALLLIHTLGILEIVYLFGFRTDRATNPLFGNKQGPSMPSSPTA
jgi:methionyl-tRNA synthetase